MEQKYFMQDGISDQESDYGDDNNENKDENIQLIKELSSIKKINNMRQVTRSYKSSTNNS